METVRRVQLDHAHEKPNKDLSIFLNEIKAAYREEIQSLFRVAKYGLRFLTDRECGSLQHYSRNRWTRQGVSMSREEYQKNMKGTIAAEEDVIPYILKESNISMNWIARSHILNFFLIPFLADIHLSGLPSKDRT